MKLCGKLGLVESIKQYMAKIGKRGGKARLTKMTAEQRRKVAQQAAKARWAKEKKKNEKGVVITLVAVFMLAVICAMAALSIDVVTLYTARSEAQLAVDAAALAAARVMANSGATSDPTGALLGTVQSSGGVARTIALQIAEQNLVARVPLTPAQITIGFGGTTTNPTVTVSVKKNDLPTFFARIWGLKQLAVAASATAEAYNPSGDYALNLSDPVPVAPTSVKPWLLPNLDPSSPANPIFVPATGTVSATATGLLGYTTPPAGGSTRLKLACGETGTANPPNCVAPGLPAPIAFQYYPGDPASFTPPPQSSAPSCNPALNTAYQYSVAGSIQVPISCNAKVNIDQGAYAGRNTETADAVNCMAHTTGNQGDTVPTGTAPPTDPFYFVAGTDNPIPSLAGNSEMVSDSLVTVPVFDTTGGVVPANPVTIVGFLQLFLAPGGLATPASGHMRATVINVVSCGSGWTANPIIGNGSSPVTVRLISPPPAQ
jgi:hypothetical protein